MQSSSAPTKLTRANGIARYIPLLGWLPRYDRSALRFDIIAALTTWALVVPQSIAYAQIAGLPPQAGLFTAFGALLGYALFGTSRQLIVSPASATAAVSASLVAPLALGDMGRYARLSSELAFLVGACFVVYGFLNLGFVSQFIATSVQAGLMFGLGMTIIASQLPKLLGIPGVDGSFIDQCANLLRNIGATNVVTLALGAVSLLALEGLKRLAPRFPTALAVVFGSIVAVTLLNVSARGVEVIGNVGTQVPRLWLPLTSLGDIATLLPGVIALSLIGYAESDTVTEEFASKHNYDVVPDQELKALGAANIASGLFGGFIVAGGASQSATNERAGARTQLSGLLVALLILLTALALMPLFANLAQAVLGAIVISAVSGFINVPALRRIRRLRRDSFGLALFALFAVLILGILPGLLLAVFLSLGYILVRSSKARASILGRLPEQGEYASVETHADAQPIPGLLIFRLDAPLMAINAQTARTLVLQRVRAVQPVPRVVLFDLEMSTDLDVESLDKLAQLQRELAALGVELWLARVHSAARAMLARSGLDQQIGAGRVFGSVAAGVRAFEALP